MADNQWRREVLRRAAQRVLDGEGFSYDPDKDPSYRQYEKTYTRLGKRAMEDTVGKVSARTGGLASSYAQTAGQQAYGNYMAQLADKVPELEQQAYQRYTDRADRAMEQVELLRKLEQDDYQRRRDKVKDAQDQRDFDRRVYEDERDFDRAVAERDRDYEYKVQQDTAKAQADRQKVQTEAAADTKEQLREDMRVYLEQGGTLDGLRNTFGTDAADRAGYLPGQLEQMEKWYKQKNAPKPTSSGKSGTKTADKDADKPTDWTGTEQWYANYGDDGMEDWFKANYKKLGFSSVDMARAAWGIHLKEKGRLEEQEQEERNEQVEQAVADAIANGTNRPANSVLLRAVNDLLKSGVSKDDLHQVLADWAAKGWRDL